MLLIRADEPLSADITNTDPAYVRVGGFGAAKETRGPEKVMKSAPETRDGRAARAARLVNEFTSKAHRVLDTSEEKRERVRAGRLPANMVLLRDAGDHLPRLPSFEEKYGMKGTALVEMPAEVGIARLLGMRMIPIKDRKDMGEKARLFSGELTEGSVVYVHIKGPDEFGHDGDARGKLKNFESIDRDFLAPVAEVLDDVRVGVSCDHATPCALRRHSADPVPLLVTGGQKRDAMRFNEASAALGSLGHLRGRDVLDLITRSSSSTA